MGWAYLTGILAAIIVASADHALGDGQVIEPLVALIPRDNGNLHLVDDKLVGGLGYSRRKLKLNSSNCQWSLLTILILTLAPTDHSAELLGTQILDVGRRQADGQQMLMKGDTMGQLGEREERRNIMGLQLPESSCTHLEERYVIVMGDGHVILRMWNHCFDLDLLWCIGKRIPTRDTQLYGPILKINDRMTVWSRRRSRISKGNPESPENTHYSLAHTVGGCEHPLIRYEHASTVEYLLRSTQNRGQKWPIAWIGLRAANDASRWLVPATSHLAAF